MPYRTVADLMQAEVVTLHPEMSAREAQRVLASHHISGAPVVDDAGGVLGVVSQADLARLEAERPTTAAAGAFFTDVADYRELAALPADEGLVRVESLMQRRVLSVPPGTEIAEAAARMREHRVHRLLVTEGGRLRGVVSAFDLLRVLAEPGVPPGGSA
jgi:CBS domain-containing protein